MRAGRREWIGLAVLALPCVLYSMDLTVLYMAVPKLSAALHPSSVELLWITDIYGFMLAGLLLTMGSVGDRIGRRRLLLIGAAAFGAASLLAAFSPSAHMLIAARALLGVAGATLAPSTLSLLHGMFADERQRTFAVGVWIASFSAAAAGGLVLTQVGVRQGLAALVAGSLVMGLGSGFVGTVATDVVVSAAPADRSGAAAAISETGAELGGALGIAVLGSIGLAVYRAHLGGALPGALHHLAATGTLADAAHASARLPAPRSGELFHAAAGAFTDSLQVVAAGAATVTLLLALAAGLLLRRPA